MDVTVRTKAIIFTLGILIFFSSARSENVELELIDVLPIEGPKDFNPSGLAFCQGEIVLVSDKHDHAVYKLVINEQTAQAEVLVNIDNIPDKSFPDVSWSFQITKFLSGLILDRLYDWEGVSCDQNGHYYLISETFTDVLKVSKTGDVTWLNLNMFNTAYSQGLFQGKNFIEGITWNGSQQFIFAVERGPRGILVANGKQTNQWEIKTHDKLTSKIKPKEGRQGDFTGLAFYKGYLLTLERNASSVCARVLPNLMGKKCWSYEHVENNPKFSFSDRRYGIAEGIVATENALYIVVDNNGDVRTSDNLDSRPLIYKFKLPSIEELAIVLGH